MYHPTIPETMTIATISELSKNVRVLLDLGGVDTDDDDDNDNDVDDDAAGGAGGGGAKSCVFAASKSSCLISEEALAEPFALWL